MPPSSSRPPSPRPPSLPPPRSKKEYWVASKAGASPGCEKRAGGKEAVASGAGDQRWRARQSPAVQGLVVRPAAHIHPASPPRPAAAAATPSPPAAAPGRDGGLPPPPVSVPSTHLAPADHGACKVAIVCRMWVVKGRDRVGTSVSACRRAGARRQRCPPPAHPHHPRHAPPNVSSFKSSAIAPPPSAGGRARRARAPAICVPFPASEVGHSRAPRMPSPGCGVWRLATRVRASRRTPARRSLLPPEPPRRKR